jgi:hypothetical protein
MNEESKYFGISRKDQNDVLKHPLVKVGIAVGASLILILVAAEVMKILAEAISSYKDLKIAINR